MQPCLFCEIRDPQPVLVSKYFNVVKDKFPVTEGHLLIVPKAHRVDVFELNEDEFAELRDVLAHVRREAGLQDPSIVAWNIGMNCGEAAGQTIFHCHVHVIPRRNGDVENPRGGVRGVIPAKQSY